MNNVQLSIDKVAIKYHEVRVNFYNKLALFFRDWFDIRPVIRHKGYVYHWNLGVNGAYLYLRYQPWWQKKSRKYTLQIETHPDYLMKFRTLLDALYGHSQEVYFNRCELAYDFPYPMSNVFLASNTGRNMNVYEGTRYFGRKEESKGHAFCRNYDKKAEQLSKGMVEVGERTRVELVYKPDGKIPIESIIQYPPKFNDYYTCSIIGDLQVVRAEKRAMILALQHGLITPDELSKHHRASIKEIMSSQQLVDFDALAARHWADLITVPCTLICGKVSHLPVQAVRSG
ncbi:replication initiation factor family protein [Paenibacillus thiaminolyticus]|uniref:replication initiation factor family protein n=1 Tax=Paenibacillus thiaminolyticus TaxID=49283 RepID=UPI003D2B4934